MRMLICTLIASFVAAAAPPVHAADVQPGATIRYVVPREAFVTLNITRPDGWVVRELTVCEKQRAGNHSAFWDGRDNNGRILPSGSYQWRLLHHAGIRWEYVTSIGNGGTPPWRTADRTGGWGGNHGNALAVAVDSTGVYMGWTSTEGPNCVIKRTGDGSKGIWGIHLGPFEGVTHLAVDGQYLYAANPRKLRKIDRETGRVLATSDLKAGKPEDAVAPLVDPPGSVTGSFRPEHGERWMGGCIWGLAAGGGRVYLSNPWRNVIQVFDTESLQPVPDENIEIHRPRGLAVDGNGRLLVVSDRKVSAVDPGTGRIAALIIAGLDAPLAIACGTDGIIYVTEAGELHQAKKFSADGTLLATFGRKGGGTDYAEGGEFQPRDFRAPAALAVNADGDFWVVEDMIPKRIACFSATGRLLYQGFGSVNYAATISPNPNDPSEVFSTMWGTFTARVDYENKTWKMGRILRARWGEGGIQGIGLGYNPVRLLARDGKTYMWTGEGLFIVEQNHLRPVMYFSPRIPDKGPLAELAKERNAKPRGWNTDVTIWTDDDGDAAMQPDEVRFVPLPRAKHGPQYFGQRGMADDFSLITWGYSWKPAGFSPGGAPVYRDEEIVCSPAFDPDDFTWAGTSPLRDTKGNYYTVMHVNDTALPFGSGFWSGRTSQTFLASYDRDWSTRWTIGRHAKATAKPGEMYYLWKTDGELDGCIFVSDVEGIVHIIHSEGFYVQSILKDPRRNPEPGPDVIRVENFSGQVFEHPQTHKRYLYVSSSEAGHVFELNGLDSIAVAPPGDFTLQSPVVPAIAREARREARCVIKRVPPSAGKSGRDAILPNRGIDWMKDVPALLLYRDGTLAAEIRLAYDDAFLYVLADVLSHRPFQNSGKGQKTMHTALDHGDTVELLCGPYAADISQRAKPVNGDTRLVFSGNKPWEMGCVVSRCRPVNQEPPEAAFTYEIAREVRWLSLWEPRRGGVSNRLDGRGYILQMAIPLDQFLPQGHDVGGLPGSTLAFDVGVSWAAGGKKVKAYWSGKNKKMLAADDAATEAQLYPDGWGLATFEGQPAGGGETLTAPRTPEARAAYGKPARIPGPGGRLAAEVRLAYDDANLYAHVTVSDDSPLKNGASIPEMMIKGGDVVALCFGKVAGTGHEQKIAAAPLGNGGTVVAYRLASDVKKPYTFESPVSKVTLDYVALLPEVKAEFRKAPEEGGVYWVDFTIPWKVLGCQPKPGMKIPFDVQIIFSDPGGSVNAYSAWWHSRSAESACTVDLPTEAKLYPEQWGELALE